MFGLFEDTWIAFAANNQHQMVRHTWTIEFCSLSHPIWRLYFHGNMFATDSFGRSFVVFAHVLRQHIKVFDPGIPNLTPTFAPCFAPASGHNVFSTLGAHQTNSVQTHGKHAEESGGNGAPDCVASMLQVSARRGL